MATAENEGRPVAGGAKVVLNPKRWPVRWRLAGVSAGLTLLILVIFALVVGRLVSNRLHNDFDTELRETANRMASELQAVGRASVSPDISRLTIAGTAVAQVVNSEGRVLEATPPGGAQLGPPDEPEITTVGPYRVATVAVPTTAFPPIFVQYARTTDSLQNTIHRLWLFLGLGVLGGTLLAALAGVWVASRAMRPISSLTATAREITATRDPSQRVPQPETDDEVAELARTLDQMLRELDAARTETENMIQAQREFVADASHELRTPLTSILANLELLQEELEGRGGEAPEIVESALRSSKRMRRLVADLLILARADAGRTSPHTALDLAEVASAAVDEVRPVAGDHLINIRAAGSVPVEGNADELHRLTLNLLDNSVRHTPAGTAIDVAVERRDGQAVLEVTDDGPGIPEDLREQVFSRFVRGNGPADVVGMPGTGLGLAIVKAVAESHGGAVEAGASAAGGARFTVRIPLEPVPARVPENI
jgi:signal transduction histidine kinase